MRCQVCQAEIPPSNISVEKLLAKCASCPAVFNFPMEQLPGAPDTDENAESRISQPKSVQVIYTLDQREIWFRWFQLRHIFMVFFCLFWNGFLVIWYFAALDTPNPDLIMILFPLLHVAAGLILTYSTLTGFCNRTRVFLADEHLVVRHQPLPWPGNCRIPITSIKQLRCDVKTSSDSSGRESRTYNLRAVLNGRHRGEELTLISGRSKQSELLFIKQQLEQWLRIKDSST